MLTVFLAALGALLPITNPLGAVAAYAGLTGNLEPAEVKRQAVRTAVYVAAILTVFALFGSLVLEAFGIGLPALQIAGGIVVAHSGFGMISPRQDFTDAEREHARTKTDVSFSPMALPLIAGPGAIGVVIALSARHAHADDRVGIVLAVLAVSVLIGLVLRYGTPLVDRLGPTGIGALVRIIGFLILAIGVELIVHGLLAGIPGLAS
ncbi:MarC family protein [Spongisporangium articulatum]|uniref:UPF0056 membrane protein n=1 Tax=Spongisporangium articulatum TaxID=3362603 RepID=A0ABW8ASD5_9ACTN